MEYDLPLISPLLSPTERQIQLLQHEVAQAAEEPNFVSAICGALEGFGGGIGRERAEQSHGRHTGRGGNQGQQGPHRITEEFLLGEGQIGSGVDVRMMRIARVFRNSLGCSNSLKICECFNFWNVTIVFGITQRTTSDHGVLNVGVRAQIPKRCHASTA